MCLSQKGGIQEYCGFCLFLSRKIWWDKNNLLNDFIKVRELIWWSWNWKIIQITEAKLYSEMHFLTDQPFLCSYLSPCWITQRCSSDPMTVDFQTLFLSKHSQGSSPNSNMKEGKVSDSDIMQVCNDCSWWISTSLLSSLYVRKWTNIFYKMLNNKYLDIAGYDTLHPNY